MDVIFTIPIIHFFYIIEIYLYHSSKKWNIITIRVEEEFNVSGKGDIIF